MKCDDYIKTLQDNVTKTYKKAPDSLPEKINLEAKTIAGKFKIADRVDVMAEQEAFFTIKDHKEDFRTNPKYRLLNPTKSELGKLSQSILQKINKTIKEKLGFNQWHNTSEVIDWFQKIPEKHSCSFTIFDIEEFYPSISENLLVKALKFAKQHTNIKKEDLNVINHCRKSLLYCNGNAWVKKNGNQNFDVTMGSYDGAEVCEIVGIFLLNTLSKKYQKKDIGLYRDDGLAVFKNVSARENDKIRKDLIKIFKDNDLKLEIKCNLKSVDYLDVTFDLETGTYKPYSKPNNTIRYIDARSNHPPNIIKQLPKSISKRISSNSSTKEIFTNTAPYYNNILKNCGYKENIEFIDNNANKLNANIQKKKNRQRNIIWYNPPFSKNVKTNIAKKFLNLTKKHFPKNHKFNKIFNKNNIKVSYSCMDSMKKILSSHNKKILTEKTTNKPDNTIKTCNCRNKPSCPLNGSCLTENVIYKAEVTTSNTPDNETKTYIGLSEPPFKNRFSNHSKSFKHRKYENETELSKYIWALKDKGLEYKINWSILRETKSYNPVTKSCNLCLTEKLMLIIERDKDRLLNKRSEMISKCRHQNKYILKNKT